MSVRALPSTWKHVHRKEKERDKREKTMPFGVNLMTSQVLYRAAQEHVKMHCYLEPLIGNLAACTGVQPMHWRCSLHRHQYQKFNSYIPNYSGGMTHGYFDNVLAYSVACCGKSDLCRDTGQIKAALTHPVRLRLQPGMHATEA